MPKAPVKKATKKAATTTKKTTSTRKPPKPPAKKATPAEGRKVIYPEPKAQLFVNGRKAGPLTADLAKKMLGWQEETDVIKFGKEYLFKDAYDRKVRCTNNNSNRPLQFVNVLVYKQEMLTRKWRFNFEPVIIGETGQVLDGQHTLIALVLAAQEQEKDPDKYAGYWDEEPTIDKLVCYGCKEDDETVNTINTGRPRSLADVIYRSAYFASLQSKDRKLIARIAESAVKLVWRRTHSGQGSYVNYLTHSQALDFINRHERLLEAIRHIYEENNDNSISRYLSLGTAAGLLYMMGTCSTITETESGDGYLQVANPNESLLNFDNWDKACEFFVLLSAGNEKMKDVKKALGVILEDEVADLKARMAIVVKAWNLYVDDAPITAKQLELEFETRDDVTVLVDFPTVGGIDLGEPTV